MAGGLGKTDYTLILRSAVGSLETQCSFQLLVKLEFNPDHFSESS